MGPCDFQSHDWKSIVPRPNSITAVFNASKGLDIPGLNTQHLPRSHDVVFARCEGVGNRCIQRIMGQRLVRKIFMLMHDGGQRHSNNPTFLCETGEEPVIVAAALS